MDKKKKILLVSNTAWSLFNFRLVLITFLSKKGFNVTAVAPADEYANKLIGEGVSYSSIKIDNKGSNPIKDLLLLFRFLFKYIKHKPDLIIHYTIKPNIYGSIAAGLLRIKSIAVVTGLGYAFIQRGFTTRLVILLYKFSLSFSDKVLFLNETDRTFFCRLKIVNRAKTIVIPGEGVDTTFFTPQQVSIKNQCVFLFVGRLLYDKGLAELIDAMRLLKKVKPEAKLQIVGFIDALNPTAVTKAQLDAWIEEGIVDFLGATSDVRSFIAQSSCVVLPSYREGVSRTLLEAASMAKPIIATDVVGCREIVVDGENGFLCKVKNSESLFEAMLKFTNLTITQQQQMGIKGRLFIKDNFSDEQVILTYTPLLNSLLEVSLNEKKIEHHLNISIITVVLDNHAFVRDAIESVLAQSYKNVQYIIIDGVSNDGSLEIIKSFGDKIAIVVSEPDDGIYDAMNKGLALATGDVIGFLNADDFYANKNVLQHVADKFAQTNCDAMYADLDYVSRTDSNKIVRKWRSGQFNKNRFLKGWMPPHPTFFVHKNVYQKLGGFNKKLHMAGDYELMLRFCYFNNLQVAYLPQVIIKMRLGGQSNRSFKNRIKANIQDRNAWVINGVRPKWYTLLLKPLSKIKQYFL